MSTQSNPARSRRTAALTGVLALALTVAACSSGKPSGEGTAAAPGTAGP